MKAIFFRQATVFMLPLLLLVAGVLLFTGCESDTVAPHDEDPALTQEDVAYQTMYLGQMFNEVAVQAVSYVPGGAVNKQNYTYDFPGESDIAGVINLDFRTGGENGTSATYNEADYVHLYTGEGAPLVLALGLGGSATITFDLTADIVQATDTATITVGSKGSFVSGVYSSNFAFNDVVVIDGNGYPESGSIDFTTGDTEIVLVYDGDNTAQLLVAGIWTYTVNLDSGVLTEV